MRVILDWVENNMPIGKQELIEMLNVIGHSQKSEIP
jgi:hypothetical protein